MAVTGHRPGPFHEIPDCVSRLRKTKRMHQILLLKPRQMRTIKAALLCLGLLASCRPAAAPPSNRFVLPAKVSEAGRATTDLLVALEGALEDGGEWVAPYPATGQVVTSPAPDNPNGSLEACAQPFAPVEGALPCISLNDGGDLIRLQPVTWQTQAAFMYLFYFAPTGGGTIDPTRDFIAVDVFLQHQPDSLPVVEAAIQAAALKLGAVPFQPTSSD